MSKALSRTCLRQKINAWLLGALEKETEVRKNTLSVLIDQLELLYQLGFKTVFDASIKDDHDAATFCLIATSIISSKDIPNPLENSDRHKWESVLRTVRHHGLHLDAIDPKEFSGLEYLYLKSLFEQTDTLFQEIRRMTYERPHITKPTLGVVKKSAP